ncbi:MAG: RES family NAD+ phosphorylase [Polyangiaceae bacterium]
MIAYRLCRRPFVALDGEGARLYGGRWNPKGVPMVYAASTLSLAALECLVHFSPNALPTNYVAVTIDVPESVRVETWTPAKLPKDWGTTPAPAALQELGARWVREGRTAVLLVPSAVIPSERVVLINPRHADAGVIRRRKTAAFSFDKRLTS